MAKRQKIIIKKAPEIQKMREAGAMASEILQATAKFIEAGKTTLEVDQFAKDMMDELGCKSAFYRYRDFPGQICISMNEAVVHGIGDDRGSGEDRCGDQAEGLDR